MEMLTSWKADYDLRLSAWKDEHDKTLSALVKEVTELKNQCVAIQKTTTDLMVRMRPTGGPTRARGKDLVNRQRENPNPNRQSYSAAAQLLPPSEGEKVSAPKPIASEGKPEPATRDNPKPRVIVPVPAEVTNITMDVTERDGWTEVRHKRSRRSLGNVLRGTAAPGTTKLEASERWRYLHLFYVKQGTSDSQVRDHLNTICGTDVCTVEVLKSRGKYASVKLGVPSKLAELVIATDNWAEDICVKP